MTASPLKKIALLNTSDREDVKRSLRELVRILGIVDVNFAGSTSSLAKRHEELTLALLRKLGD